MPLYEYKCQRCGNVFEVIQKFSDEPLRVHADCGGALERLLFPPALHFKGKGWYITDYGRARRSKKDAEPAPPKPADAKTPAKPESESKPSASAGDK